MALEIESGRHLVILFRDEYGLKIKLNVTVKSFLYFAACSRGTSFFT